jgi:hypothetical protein
MLRAEIDNKGFSYVVISKLNNNNIKIVSINVTMLGGLTKLYKYASSALSEMIESGKHFTQKGKCTWSFAITKM